VAKGTDVNFGALTNKLLKLLGDSPDAQVKYSKKVSACAVTAAAGP
jgi:malate dehydrogenase (quinone)